jgi:hypothetical protein
VLFHGYAEIAFVWDDRWIDGSVEFTQQAFSSNRFADFADSQNVFFSRQLARGNSRSEFTCEVLDVAVVLQAQSFSADFPSVQADGWLA